jgi:hypothetical protein
VVLPDTMGPALLVVLDTLIPAERLAFVLHDLFAVPLDEVALIVGRSRRPLASSPVAPDGACRAPRRCPPATGGASRRSSTRSWQPPGRGITKRSCNCSGAVGSVRTRVN